MPDKSYVIRSNGLIDDLGINSSSSPDEKVKVSATDTSTDYLMNKIVIGDFLSGTQLSPGSDESLQIDVIGGDAATIIYDPTTLSDWNGSTSPGHVDLAFDQLAERVKDLEGSINDAANLLYTPSDLSDWNSSADPGNAGPALDQLADRVKFLEANFGSAPDAANVTYTPAVNSNWNSSADPGDVDNALDQLAARTKTLETTPPNASVIPYTPSDNTDWNGSVDPGDVDDALNQLADRIKAAEVAGALPTVAVSATDTTPDYLFDKITAGSRITVTKTNAGSNEHVQITASIQDASILTYTPGQLTDWNSSADPGDVDDALNQLAARLKSLEGSVGPTPDASAITYTPTTNSDWTGSADPGNVDDALDQVAGRVKVLETHYAAGDLPYTPADNTKWNSNTDPGDVNDALDQLASRMKVVEAATGGAVDASVVTYTPSDNTKWNSNTDPGDTDDALNQLASRVKTLETSISVDAAAVTYTPSDTSKWNSGVDPGNTDGALNQLASRVKSLETTATDASNVTYVPSSNANWNSSTDPGNADDALDQLASRVKTIETTPPNASVIPYTPADNTDWNSSADPGDVDNALDQLADRVKFLELSGGGGGAEPNIVLDYIESTDLYNGSSFSSGSWQDISTSQNFTLASGSSLVSFDVSGQIQAGTNVGDAGTRLLIDGTTPYRLGGSRNVGGYINVLQGISTLNITGLASGAHTLKLQIYFTAGENVYLIPSTSPEVTNLHIQVIEYAPGSGGAPDASVVTYTPADTADWDSSADPGDVDNALDQLASRVKAVEAGGGGGSTSGFLTMDTTLNGTYTIPSEYQAIVVDEIYVQSGTLTVTGRLCILESEIVAESADIGYDPNDTGDWNTTPTNAKTAFDQLADRVKTIETGGGGGGTVIYHRWDVDAPPVSASAADDEFNDATFNTGMWTLYDHGSNSLAASEDDQGLLLSGDGDADEWMGIYTSLPSGNFSISTKVMGYGITENNSQFGIALFEDGATSTADMVYFGVLTSGGTTFAVVQTFDSYNQSTGSQLAFEAVGGLTLYLRLRRNGTTFFSEFSVDGESWFNHPDTFTLGYVPQHMGLVFRRTTSTSNYRLRSRFFRYLNSDTGLYAPINGRNMAVLSS